MSQLPYPVVFQKLPESPGRWPKVSIIVPARNEEISLSDCLDSLQKQVYPDFEIIVVDDASTDRTSQIAVQMNVRLYRLDKRGGPGAARNLGASKAIGDILLFCEADGAYPADHVARHVVLLSRPGIHAAHLGGRRVQATSPTWVSKIYDRWLAKSDYLILKGKRGTGAFAFDRKAFEELGGYDKNLRHGEDVQLVSRLVSSGMRFAFAVGSGWWHKDPKNATELLGDAIRRGESIQKTDRRSGFNFVVHFLFWLALALSPLGLFIGFFQWRFLLWPLTAAGFFLFESRPFFLAAIQSNRDEGVTGILKSIAFAYLRRLGFGIGRLRSRRAQ